MATTTNTTVRRLIAIGMIAFCGAIGGASTMAQPPMATVNFLGERSTDEELTNDVSREIAGDMSGWISTVRSLRGGLRQNDGYLRTSDDIILTLLVSPNEGEAKLLRRYSPDIETGVRMVPESYLELLDEELDSLRAEIKRLAPSYSLPAGPMANEAIATEIAESLKTTAPGATVVHTVLGQRWNVTRTTLGIPRSRSISGVVIYRVPTQELDICREILVEQTYFSENDDSASYRVKLGHMRFQQPRK